MHYGASMNIKTLRNLPPWEWPEDAGDMLLAVMRDPQADESDRLLAAELAGDFTVVNDDLVDALLSILCNRDENEDLRGTAAISLGPALEYAHFDAFDDPFDVPITEDLFHRAQETLQRLYADAGLPRTLRRYVLEASVRAPQPWHHDAVQAAYASDDQDWKLTAVFCMKYVRGFDAQILESLESRNSDIHYEAVCAARNWEIDAAWPHIVALLTSEEIEKPLLLVAIEAAAFIRPHQATEILAHLLDSDDEDIVDTVYEALALVEEPWEDDDEDDEDEDNRTLH
jgi:hypothetical protein